MSKFDENIFGRIALLNNYLTREELEKCLEDQRSAVTQKNIGQVLLENGFLSEDQLERILDIRNKKVRKFLRRRDDSTHVDQQLGKLLLAKRLLSLEGLEASVLEQQRLNQLNLHFSLAEVVVSRGGVSIADVLDVYSRQGWRMKLCPVCDAHYRITDYEEHGAHHCPRCETELHAPAFLDSLMVEGVIGSDNVDQMREIATENS